MQYGSLRKKKRRDWSVLFEKEEDAGEIKLALMPRDGWSDYPALS